LSKDLQALNILQDVNGIMMSSLDIAEICNKLHKHVLRDIDVLLESLSPSMGLGFKSTTYKDSTGKSNRMFELDKDSTLCLMSGYDVNARMKIIKRWQELEQQQIPSVAPAQQSVHEACLASLTWLSENLRLSESSKVKLLSDHHKELGLPSAIIPNYVDEKITNSLTALLKKHGSKLSARKANLILVELGYLEQLERKSTKGDKIRKFYSITATGLQYGKNSVSPNNPRQTQPLFYRNTFEDFLGIINSY